MREIAWGRFAWWLLLLLICTHCCLVYVQNDHSFPNLDQYMLGHAKLPLSVPSADGLCAAAGIEIALSRPHRRALPQALERSPRPGAVRYILGQPGRLDSSHLALPDLADQRRGVPPLGISELIAYMALAVGLIVYNRYMTASAVIRNQYS